MQQSYPKKLEDILKSEESLNEYLQEVAKSVQPQEGPSMKVIRNIHAFSKALWVAESDTAGSVSFLMN